MSHTDGERPISDAEYPTSDADVSPSGGPSTDNPASTKAGLTDAEMTGAVRPDSSRRGADTLRGSITRWLAARPGLRDVTVDEVVIPESNGMSSETVLVTASWVEDTTGGQDGSGRPSGPGGSSGSSASGGSSGSSEQRLVFRMAPDPDTMPIFEHYDLGVQFRVMADVGRLTDIPVPDAMWYEGDPAHLGSEFFVMDRRDGEIPADVLPYNLGDSFLFDAPAADQHRLQNNSVALLVSLHSIDDPLREFDYLAASVGLGDEPGGSNTAGTPNPKTLAVVSGVPAPETTARVPRAGGATTGSPPGVAVRTVSGAECLTNHIERMRRHYDYVKRDSRPSPLIDRAFEWLDAKMPDADTIGEPVLLWGDSRIGNVIYRDFEPVGVLDWEMATIGDPLMDLGTTLCYWVEDADPPPVKAFGFGPTSLPGMLTRAELAARYAEATGRDISNIVFYFTFGLFKTAVVLQQIYYRYKQGLTTDQRFAMMIEGVRLLALMAERAVTTDSL